MITPLTTNLNVHQGLPNRPNANDGLTPEEIKVLFDKAPNEIKDYINNTLLTELPSAFVSEGEITIERKLSPTGDFTGTWNGLPMIETDPGLSSRVAGLVIEVDALESELVMLNIESFGVNGDGTDETALVQEAFTAANGKHLVIPSYLNILITDRITMPENIVVHCDGEFTCTGDQEYWFYTKDPKTIIFENFKATVTMPFADRTLLNRVLFCDTPTYFEVKKAEIIGASTAAHCLYGEDFVCGEIILRNVYGTAAQYGYGLNSSAKRTNIHSLTAINDETTHGRHAIYINGNQWENVNIDSIYVRNWNKNPINIANTEPTSKCYIHVGSAVFVNANIEPTDANTGCIHGTNDNGVDVRIHVETMYVRNIAGSAFSVQGTGGGAAYIGYLYAEDLAPASFVSTYLVNLRYGSNKHVGKVVCTALNTNWLATVFLRDTTNGIVDDVYQGGAAVGSSTVLRLNNGDALLGSIQAPNMPKVATVGSVTIRYKDNSLRGTVTWNPASLADGAGETSAAITVTGAALGDYVNAAPPYDLQGITCNAYVSAADTVRIRIQNETGGVIDLASGAWKVRVMKDLI